MLLIFITISRYYSLHNCCFEEFLKFNTHLNKLSNPILLDTTVVYSAQFCAVIIYNFYSGIKIGFPLTQTCVLIAALWGIKYFKEFDLQKSGFLFRFCMGILLILVGAYLLGTSG